MADSLVTKNLMAATTMPTMTITAPAQMTCSIVTEPRSSRCLVTRSSREASVVSAASLEGDEEPSTSGFFLPVRVLRSGDPGSWGRC
ncbi:hypothetical protein G5V59_18680 [Nocardioides sp. W3-2-3]|nr:hypothetical protein [Nocardioides convexus]